MKILTLQTLKEKRACSSQVDLFKDTFGESVMVTEKLCIQYVKEFDWNWAAKNLLSEPASKIYDETRTPALKAYIEAIASAWKVYDEDTVQASKAYVKARASAWKEYDEAREPASKVYVKTIASALKAYDEALASAFARAYINQ